MESRIIAVLVIFLLCRLIMYVMRDDLNKFHRKQDDYVDYTAEQWRKRFIDEDTDNDDFDN